MTSATREQVNAELTQVFVEHDTLPLAKMSSLHIGGMADIVASPTTVIELKDCIRIARQYKIPFRVIGRGSNLLFDDAGYRDMIIRTYKMKEMEVFQDAGLIRADAGVPLIHLAMTACRCGLGDFSFATGIPGSVGGAVYMNAGAFGGDIASVLLNVTVFDTATRQTYVLSRDELEMSYRHSNLMAHRNRVVLEARFKLSPAPAEELLARAEEYRARRDERQPLDYPSAGSAFLSHDGVSIGKLLDEAGLKGYTVGGAQISPKHAGFIVNLGDATAADIRALIAFAQKTVEEKYGFVPQTEMEFVPERE